MHKKFLLLIGIVCFLHHSLQAATIYSNAVTGNWTAGTSWNGGVVPGAGDEAVIINGASITVNANISIQHVQIDGGGVLNGSGNTINITGNWTVNGTYNRGTSTVNFNGSGAQSMYGTGNINFQHIRINNNNGSAGMGVTAHNVNTNIHGNVEQNGVFNRNFGKVTFAGSTVVTGATSLILHDVDILSGASLNGATGIAGGSSNMYFSGHWNNMGAFNPGTGTVSVQYSSSYATQNISMGGSSFYNLTLNKSVNVAPQDNITVQNDFTIIQGTWNAAGYNLNVAGDFNNMDTFSAGNGRVRLNGTGIQNINMGGSNLYNFTINKSSGEVFQGANVRVINSINFSSGVIHTYTALTTMYELYLSNNSAGAVIGGSSGSFVVGNFKRAVISGAANYGFPLGVLNSSPLKYRPITYSQSSSGGAAWVNMISDVVGAGNINSADWYVRITTSTGNPSGEITMTYNIANDFSTAPQECLLSIIRGQASPPPAFWTYVLQTTTAPSGGNNGSISAELPASLSPYEYIVGEPEPVASGSTVCEGESDTLIAEYPNGNVQFNWYDDPSGSNLLLANSDTFFTPIMSSTTTYYLEYYDSFTNCGGNLLPVTVNVNPAPSSDFSLPDSACAGDTVLISFLGTVSATATYDWDFYGGAIISGSGGTDHEVYWSSPGSKNVSLQIYDTPCNSFLTTDSIEIVPTPSSPVISTSSTFVCEGEEVIISASGSTGGDTIYYEFYDAATGGNFIGFSPIIDTPLVTTTYYLEVSNEHGCKSDLNRDSVTITVYPPAPISDFTIQDTACLGDTVNIVFSGTISNTATYFWDFDGGILVNGSGYSDQEVYWNTPGYKNVSLVVNEYPCSSPLTVHTIEIVVSPSPAELAVSSNAVCAGEEVIITASGSSGGDSIYYDFYDASTGGNFIGASPLNVTPGDTTTYYLEVTNEFGCKSSFHRDSVTILVYPIPVVHSEYTGDVILCYGEDTALNVVVTPPPEAEVFWWDSEAGGNFISRGDTLYTDPLYNDETFWAEATTLYNCTHSDRIPVSVRIITLPEPTLEVIPPELHMDYNTAYVGQELTITANPAGYVSYEFYRNNQLAQVGAENTFTSSVSNDGDMISILAENQHCRGFINDSLQLRILPLANAFTPNGDGINDLFLKGLDLVIMNRWGQELYRGDKGWDGTYKGKETSPGTYYYIYTLYGPDREEIKKSGALMLIRER